MTSDETSAFITRDQFDDDHRQTVCRIGQGHACCRYLTIGPQGWDCEKNSNLARLLDQRVASETITARGDNCPGLPRLEVGF